MRTLLLCWFGLIGSLLAWSSLAMAAEGPSFDTQIAPLLTKYCSGCHNSEDAEGQLSLDSFAGVSRGGESGAVITPGNSGSSRLIGVLTGLVKPKMPPEDEASPSPEEVALLAAWIDSGAAGPSGQGLSHRRLMTPKFPSVEAPAPVTSVAFSPQGDSLAIARFRQVELKPLDDSTQASHSFKHPGKVQSVRFSRDGERLITASGITGLYGEARFWNVSEGTLENTFPADTFQADPLPTNSEAGHRDMVYAAVTSSDGSILATAGYDRKILIWDTATGKLLRTLAGHNGAVFDLSISPEGTLLASASADATIKVWHIPSGQRLDTRSEPLKEQYTTAISPDGRLLVGGGGDSRIRVWRLVSTDKPEINPLVFTRFAHEGAIHLLRFSEDGSLLVSAGQGGEVKLWETREFRQLHTWPNQPASVQALSISTAAGQVAVGRMDGSVELLPLPNNLSPTDTLVQNQSEHTPTAFPTGTISQLIEAEPNNSAATAQAVAAPARIKGVIHSDDDATVDNDFFRFSSLANQTWIIEVRAAREESPLDSFVEVLSAEGNVIPRVVLQATYDSYFTFRGKDSEQTGDFRVHNWREMRLNQYLYCNGEVVRLFYYPRGPDSGYNTYPNFGNRHTFFDTPPMTHALNEPCYIVEPHSPGAAITPNGLPTFVVNYENDDDSLRRYGSDSFLTFTAPSDGEFLVRVTDVRGQQGPDYRYELAVRAPQPDFSIQSVDLGNGEIMAGAGHKFSVTINREDGFNGPVTIHASGLPAGFSATPLVVEAGHFRAWGRILAEENAATLSEDAASAGKLVPVAEIAGRKVTKWPHDLGKLTLNPSGKLQVKLAPSQPDAPEKNGMPVIEIVAGTTATFILRAERNGFEGIVSFGKEDAALNAPHGIYVDNIGLKGVQIQKDETERIVFLTAEAWVKPQEQIIFFEAEEAGKPTTNLVLLRVLSPKADVATVRTKRASR